MRGNENSFLKGNQTYRFFIYPLFYDNYKKENNKEHVLSIIYVIDQDNYYEQFSPYISFLSILFCITFFIIGWIATRIVIICRLIPCKAHCIWSSLI